MALARCLGCLALNRSTVFGVGQGRFSRLISHLYVDLHPSRMGKKWMSSLAWIPPDGHETGVTIYNSISKSKVPLKTIHPGLLTWYSCGPTVYDAAHIGHALCYVKFDIIRRILARMFNINVVMVLGITDIDDKIIKRANELGVNFKVITQKYEEDFFADMDRLRIWRPSLAPRVSEHVPQIIAFIQKIMDNKLAYAVRDGSVYFDTKKYGRYGKMGVLDPSVTLLTGGVKKSARDFALWKGSKPGEPYWESPWGRGRPGWHIECSAMANHILGFNLDLHSGGIDLLFPHHENEEAQCCAHSGDLQWCNHWIHAGHLTTKGTEKMSKSLYNTISVNEVLERHTVNEFRIFCLLSHYRNNVEYTSSSMVEAAAHMRRMRAFLGDAYAYINGQLKCGPLDEVGLKRKLAETRIKVKKYLSEDFDTARALYAVLDLITLCNKELKTEPSNVSLSRSAGTMVSICSYIHYLMEDVFGIKFPSVKDASNMSLESSGRLNEVMNSVVSFRHQVRQYALLKDKASSVAEYSKEESKTRRIERRPLLQACDTIRDDLLEKTGLQIKDHADRSSWTVTDGDMSSKSNDHSKLMKKILASKKT